MDYNTFAENIKTKYPQYQDMDNKELAQKMVVKYPEYKDVTFNEPIQGGVEKNVLLDSAKGAVSGLTEIPRALSKISAPIVEPVSNAISYPVSQGINLLKNKPTQSFNDYSQEQNALQDKLNTNYQPQTTPGKISQFVGSLLSTLALPNVNAFKGAGLLSKIGNGALTGVYQGGLIGGTNAANNNQNVMQGVGQGAKIGSFVGGGLPVAGAAFKKISPALGSIAGIGKNDYQTVFDNIKNMPVTRALLNPILGTKSAKTGEIVGNEIEKLKTMPDFDGKEINNLTQNTIDKYANGASINPTADAVRPELNQIQKYLDEGNSQLVQLSNGQTMTSDEFAQFFPDMKPKDINAKEIDLSKVKPMNLQVIKQDLQDKLDFNPDNPTYTKQGSALLRDLQHQYKNKLEEISPELGKANKEHSIAKSAEKFNQLLPQGKYHKARIAAEIAGLVPAVAGGLTHNPLMTSFGAISTLFSPLAHGLPMAGYEIGSKVSPFIPRAVVTATKNTRSNNVTNRN